MYLRNGKVYYNPGNIGNIIKLQSYFRGKISFNEFQPYLKSIKMIRKRFPHLHIDSDTKTKTKQKNAKKTKTVKKTKTAKKNKKNIDMCVEEKNNVICELNINDDEYIVSQYEFLKNMGSNLINGRKRSSRSNKGKQPERYVDENFLEIILEDSKIEDILESGSDVDTDYHSSDNFSNLDSDGEWDDNNESSSEDEWDNDNESSNEDEWSDNDTE
uniref:Uncharacterized protein n=1 Tax=viral metagenome TaxID=1070528 RepID=A0A6C0M0L5_9ZZZZ